MRLIIPGQPISKARPRFFRRGNFVGTYNAQETEEGKALLLCRDQIKEKFITPLSVEFEFYLQRPANHFGSGKNYNKLKPSAPDLPAKKPDTDNMIKFYLDILNGQAWVDDCQICKLSAVKKYAPFNSPMTVILIEEAKGL